ncbi:MAG: hypothetical protein AAGA73_22795 [Pseudomonadota bacterium]
MGVSRRTLLASSVSAAAVGSALANSDTALSNTTSKDTAGIGTDAADRQLLTRVMRVMYPHDRFPDGPYERTADAVIEAGNKTPGQRLMFADGLANLRAASFADLDEKSATAYLESIEGSTFFALLHGTGVVALYNDEEVWGLLGFQGPSFDQGGYANRGFNDLDWLPDPRITEFERG